jgi:hypothetical protein
VLMAKLEIKPILLEDIRMGQEKDEEIIQIKERANKGQALGFDTISDGLFRYQNRVCVSNNEEIRKHTSHHTQYTLEALKCIEILKGIFGGTKLSEMLLNLWSDARHVNKSKQHQKPVGPLQSLEILVWKWEVIAIDFLMELPRTQAGYDAIWMIVDRLTKAPHFISIKVTFLLENLTKLYLQEIV